MIDLERTRLTSQGDPLASQSSYRSSGPNSLPSNRVHQVTNALKVEKTAIPLLSLNPNLRYNYDEAYLAYVDPQTNKPKEKPQTLGRIDTQELPKKVHKRVEHKTYEQILQEREAKKFEEEKKQRDMEEAEKLRPVTSIRSQQGHRFIKKVPIGDQQMANELAH